MYINSIFTSIDGEANTFHQGSFSTFIRFAGCNLRCKYCDTVYAQQADSGIEMSVDEIIDKVEQIGCPKVTITGGEPLLQLRGTMHSFFSELTERGIYVTVETNGSIIIPVSLARDSAKGPFFVVDYKLPSSGMESHMLIDQLPVLTEDDMVKFVISDVVDFDRAYAVAKRIYDAPTDGPTVVLSPAWGVLEPSVLVDWCKEAKWFDTIISLQIHKVIWPYAIKEV